MPTMLPVLCCVVSRCAVLHCDAADPVTVRLQGNTSGLRVPLPSDGLGDQVVLASQNCVQAVHVLL